MGDELGNENAYVFADSCYGQNRNSVFFVRCYNGKCSVQPVGVNNFNTIPSDAANYLCKY